jgi:hypothetical protein
MEYNKVLSGYQLGRGVEWWKKKHRLEDHLCPRPQGADMNMVGDTVGPVYTCVSSVFVVVRSELGHV